MDYSRKMHYRNTNKFRINANGNKLDVWLIYHCTECKHTLNIAIYERKKVSSIPKEEYQCFLEKISWTKWRILCSSQKSCSTSLNFCGTSIFTQCPASSKMTILLCGSAFFHISTVLSSIGRSYFPHPISSGYVLGAVSCLFTILPREDRY